MQKTKKIAIYIGKFQPLHLAHEKIIEMCKEKFDYTIVLVGSVNRRASIATPFSFNMIKQWVLAKDSNAIVKPLKDYIYNETKWITQVEELVYSEFYGDNVSYTLVGHTKDETSYYLKEFPNFYTMEVPSFINNLSATNIRNDIFSCEPLGKKNYLSDRVFCDVVTWQDTKDFEILKEEFEYFKDEEKMFENYPFPETLKFMCSDAVIVCDGNILLVKRKFAPGKDVWALPGGFVNQIETFFDCAIRELKEETGLKVPKKVIRGAMKGSRIFDNPRRNIGIPRVSNAFYFEIYPDTNKKGFPKLPKVVGSDDASEAKWFSLAEVKRMNLFDDHSDIIDYFTSSI